MTRNSDCMPEVREPVTVRSSLVRRMEDQRMSESDRQAAAAWLRDGESLADFVCRATDALRSTASFLEHYLAQRGR